MWKAVAIIFIILFVLETAIVVGTVVWAANDTEKQYECYYNVCSENYDAVYQDNVCTCYDLDVMGEYVISKTEYMKK